ncbi:hypothetical protein Clacol_007532 [Clathrus columnatus]|uniref:Coatomer subunit delta n=1 Tax=Clathrus columnatus TaxID=1419009 RepID=A0AAV5ALF8_9AGAM|nr:hypothetical protein Clacol_007532 [Clathrus columnatus]
MSRSRIDSLLASFPKLIPTNSQHTSIETTDVRYVYQPLDELYILLITNKASNILQDIDTLHLFARVVSDLCRTADEREISRQAFELLGAFDEIVSLGWREQINLMQVKNNLEMESHEEKIQEIIARNKEAEAKEELKRRAKQLEMQRREQQKRATSGGGISSPSFLSGGAYSSVPRFEPPPPPTTSRSESPAPSSLRPPAFKGSGMKLGSKKKAGADLADLISGEPEELLVSPPSTSGQAAREQTLGKTSTISTVVQESVHIQIREQLTLALLREGGLKTLEVKGDLNLNISDAQFARIKLGVSQPATSANDLVFKGHPNVGKFQTNERVVALKDANRSFPVGLPLSVLKWRYSGRDESLLPLSINVWPTPSGDGTCEVNIEYELENTKLALHDVVISIPLPSGSYPTVTPGYSGQWSLNAALHSLEWSIPLVSATPAEDSTPGQTSGSMEFSVGGEEIDAFFPVKVSFVGLSSLLGIEVNNVTRADNGEEVLFSQEATLTVEDFQVV